MIKCSPKWTRLIGVGRTCSCRSERPTRVGRVMTTAASGCRLRTPVVERAGVDPVRSVTLSKKQTFIVTAECPFQLPSRPYTLGGCRHRCLFPIPCRACPTVPSIVHSAIYRCRVYGARPVGPAFRYWPCTCSTQQFNFCTASTIYGTRQLENAGAWQLVAAGFSPHRTGRPNLEG